MFHSIFHASTTPSSQNKCLHEQHFFAIAVLDCVSFPFALSLFLSPRGKDAIHMYCRFICALYIFTFSEFFSSPPFTTWEYPNSCPEFLALISWELRGLLYIYLGILDPTLLSYVSLFKKKNFQQATWYVILIYLLVCHLTSLLKQEGTLHSHVLNFIPFSFPPFRNTRTLDLNPHLLCFVHLYKEWNNDWTVQPISYPSSL